MTKIVDSLKDLTIFMISFISSFETINVVISEAKSKGWPDLNIFLWIAGSVTDAAAAAAAAAAVNSKCIKTLLANGLRTFFIKGNPVFSNGPKVYLIFLLIVLFYAIEFFIFFLLSY